MYLDIKAIELGMGDGCTQYLVAEAEKQGAGTHLTQLNRHALGTASAPSTADNIPQLIRGHPVTWCQKETYPLISFTDTQQAQSRR